MRSSGDSHVSVVWCGVDSTESVESHHYQSDSTVWCVKYSAIPIWSTNKNVLQRRRQNKRNLQERSVCVCWILNGESLTLHQSTTKQNIKKIYV